MNIRDNSLGIELGVVKLFKNDLRLEERVRRYDLKKCIGEISYAKEEPITLIDGNNGLFCEVKGVNKEGLLLMVTSDKEFIQEIYRIYNVFNASDLVGRNIYFGYIDEAGIISEVYFPIY